MKEQLTMKEGTSQKEMKTTQNEKTDNPIAGSHKSDTGSVSLQEGLFRNAAEPCDLCASHLLCFVSPAHRKTHISAPGTRSLGYQIYRLSLPFFFALWTCSGVVAYFTLKSFKWEE
jgi:hypothetical protein